MDGCYFPDRGLMKGKGDLLCRIDADDLSRFVRLESHGSVDKGKKGIISSHAAISSRVKLGPVLSDKYVARKDGLAAKTLDSKPLPNTVPSIS